MLSAEFLPSMLSVNSITIAFLHKLGLYFIVITNAYPS